MPVQSHAPHGHPDAPAVGCPELGQGVAGLAGAGKAGAGTPATSWIRSACRLKLPALSCSSLPAFGSMDTVIGMHFYRPASIGSSSAPAWDAAAF
jgi:hypothetical protein